MSHSYLIVIRIMCWSYFNAPVPKSYINIIICNNWYFSYLLVVRLSVFPTKCAYLSSSRINSYSSISKHSFWSCSSNF